MAGKDGAPVSVIRIDAPGAQGEIDPPDAEFQQRFRRTGPVCFRSDADPGQNFGLRNVGLHQDQP